MATASKAAPAPVAINLHTQLYDINGEDGNVFTVYMGTTEKTLAYVDAGYGMVEYDVAPAVYNSETQSIDASMMTFRVSEAGNVTIYCDPELIDYLDLEGMYITQIDMEDLTNLEILNMDHNQLESLDLTPFSALQSISLSDNPFNVSPLVVGANKPDLTILTLDMIDNMSDSFNISDYPALMVFSAWNNRSLHSLDLSGCPSLVRLSIDGTDVSSLDLTKVPNLRILNITDTRISSIDLSVVPSLQEFYAQHQSGTINTGIKLSSIDVSHNPELRYLYLAGNDLTDIDLSNNPLLQMLNVSHNRLTSINLDENPDLIDVNISFNYMDFTSMPLPRFNDYVYQQNPMKVDYSYPVDAVIDLKSRLIIPSSETYGQLLLPSKDDPAAVTELDGSYFSYADGVTTLLKECPDSVYMEFYNPEFPDYPLRTSSFVVKSKEDYGKPSVISSWNGDYAQDNTVALQVGVLGASPENPAKVYVDFGDGNLQEFTVTTSALPEEANITGTSKGYGQKTLAVPDGVFITAFGMHHPVYSVNTDKMTQLLDLDLSGCGLYSVDLTMNYNLQRLDLSENQLSVIDLKGPHDGLNKIMLGDIDLSENNLTEFNVPDNRTLIHLDLSDNQIAEIKLQDADFLESLDLSGNKLTYLDIHYSEAINDLDVSGNSLTDIILPQNLAPAKVDLSDNSFTMPTLPLPSVVNATEYIYAPQQYLSIPTKGPGANLAVQDVVLDGNKTSFKWFKQDGTPLTEGTDYTVSNGVTRFLNTEVGLIYCEITNPVFPALTLRTTDILAAGMPTNLIASFTTPTGGQTAGLSLGTATPGTALYIDWADNGVLDQYPLKDTYTLYEATTVKGANVKVYTYDLSEQISIFSVSGVTMKDADFSKMVDLYSLSLYDAGLDEIKLPESPGLRELTLEGSNFTSIDLTAYKQLNTLSLNNNKLSEFDLSPFKNLGVASLEHNNFTSYDLNNKSVWALYLAGNSLTNVSFSGADNLEQLALSNNQLSTIDVSKLKRLKALTLDANKFDFTTLPLPKDDYILYVYGNQAPVKAVADDQNRVDLSFNKEASDGTKTVYTWYIGMPGYNEDGELTGSLFPTEDVTEADGVSTFLTDGEDLVCLMTNGAYPDLIMYTEPITIKLSGIDATLSHDDLRITSANGSITVTAPKAITASLYSIDGKLAGKATGNDGTVVFDNLVNGVYILVTPAGAYRVLVK